MSRLGGGGIIAVTLWIAMFAAMTGLSVWVVLKGDEDDEVTPIWRRRMGRIGAGIAVFALLTVIVVYVASIDGWNLRRLPPRLAMTIVRLADVCSLFGILFGAFGQGMRRIVAVVGALLALFGWSLVELGITTTP